MFENQIPQEMTRQQANLKIYKLIKDNPVVSDKATEILQCIIDYTQQRFGQIICNYICPDYRDMEPSAETKALMSAIFPGDPDPFYEESVTTLNRLKRC